MALNTALANAGPVIDLDVPGIASEAELLAQAEASGELTPETPGEASAVVASDPSQAQAPSSAPLTVRIGETELPVAQVQPWLDNQIARLQQAEATLQPAVQLFELFQALTPEQQQATIDTIESYSDNPAPGTARTLSIDPIDLPANAAVDYDKTEVTWDRLSDEGRYNHLTALSVRHELKELSRIVYGMKAFIQQQNAESQDELTAKALQAKGFVGLDAAGVRILREKGITDPLKAAESGIIKPSKVTKPAPRTIADAPPEAQLSGEGKRFNENDQNLDPEEMGRLLAQGFTPFKGPEIPRKV